MQCSDCTEFVTVPCHTVVETIEFKLPLGGASERPLPCSSLGSSDILNADQLSKIETIHINRVEPLDLGSAFVAVQHCRVILQQQ